MWLVYLNKLLDLKKPNERRTTRLMCRTVLSDFYALKISDMTLVFKEIVSGKHGKFTSVYRLAMCY
jgi:tRNA(His) 5'-end guanylyltransferase